MGQLSNEGVDEVDLALGRRVWDLAAEAIATPSQEVGDEVVDALVDAFAVAQTDIGRDCCGVDWA